MAVAGMLGVLILATLITGVLVWRYPQRNWLELRLRIKTWWWIVGLFLLILLTPRWVGVSLIALVSFLGFKEFLTLAPTRPEDHWALAWAFLAIPVQYAFVGISWFGMFLAFIPVYMFLLLPMQMVVAGEPRGFLRAAATMQWGLMSTVFGLSHLAQLLVLPTLMVEGREITGYTLLFYIAVLTQSNDIAQYLWGKWLGRHKVIPRVSPNKTVEGLIGGVITTTALGTLIGPWLTPMSLEASAAMSCLLAFAGFVGDVVMSAVKRDIGVKDSGNLLPGHGGILDRLDSLMYTAPLFFHLLYYFYYPYLH